MWKRVRCWAPFCVNLDHGFLTEYDESMPGNYSFYLETAFRRLLQGELLNWKRHSCQPDIGHEEESIGRDTVLDCILSLIRWGMYVLILSDDAGLLVLGVWKGSP